MGCRCPALRTIQVPGGRVVLGDVLVQALNHHLPVSLRAVVDADAAGSSGVESGGRRRWAAVAHACMHAPPAEASSSRVVGHGLEVLGVAFDRKIQNQLAVGSYGFWARAPGAAAAIRASASARHVGVRIAAWLGAGGWRLCVCVRGWGGVGGREAGARGWRASACWRLGGVPAARAASGSAGRGGSPCRAAAAAAIHALPPVTCPMARGGAGWCLA